MGNQKLEMPKEYLKKWQRTVDLLARVFEVPAALIMRVWPTQIEVLVSSQTAGNPYEPHEKADLGTGLYCETVMATRSQLQVPNALQDAAWQDNPDIELNMISYLGIPLVWPDNQIFGTLCVLDGRTREFSNLYQDLLGEFKGLIENDLIAIEQNKALEIEIIRRRQAEEGLRLALDEVLQATRALRESEARYRAIFETTGTAMAILEKDMTISLANAELEKLTGYSAEEVEGKRRWTDFIAGKDLDKMREYHVARRADPTAAPPNYEFRFDDGQGNVRDILLNVAMIPGTDQSVASLLDITVRKRAEEALRESEEKHRTLFETMAQGVVYQAADGKIISANPAAERILGLTLDQMQGRTSVDPRWRAVHENGADFPGETHPAMAALKTGREVQDVMGVFNPELDAYVWINVNAVPQFRPGEDRPYQVYTTFEDITERVGAEAQLQTALREKEVLLREIHHRVKNNLQVVATLLDLQAGYVEDEEVVEMFRDSRSRIGSLALVHEKLYGSQDLSRIDLAEYIRGLTTHLFRSYRAHAGEVVLKLEVADVDLGVDTATPCGLIVTELVSNALKHAFPLQGDRVLDGRTGEICVSLCADQGRFTLIVADNGVGFPPDLDFRATDSLGLQLVIMLVDQLDGSIELDRDTVTPGEGSGTTFRIEFPEPEHRERI